MEAEEEPFAMEIEEFAEAFEEALPVVPEEVTAVEPGLVWLLSDAVLYSDAADLGEKAECYGLYLYDYVSSPILETHPR